MSLEYDTVETTLKRLNVCAIMLEKHLKYVCVLMLEILQQMCV